LHRDSLAILAHRRLSIVDLRSGRQPLSNEDGTIWVSCNGEIDNHAGIGRRAACSCSIGAAAAPTKRSTASVLTTIRNEAREWFYRSQRLVGRCTVNQPVAASAE